MAFPRTLVPTALLLILLARPAASVSLSVAGLTYPTSAVYDAANAVIWVSEKAGKIKAVLASSAFTTNASAAPARATLMLDLTALVAPIGYLGLSSLAVNPGFLWATYQQTNASFGTAMGLCVDFGVVANRSAAQVLGCPTYGVLSRFALVSNASSPVGVSLGPELRVLNAPAGMCSQFTADGITHALFDAAGTTLYVAAGAGANDNSVPDLGQFGGDPCGDGTLPGGHFRAQDPNSWDGGVLALTGTGLATAGQPIAVHSVARGFYDPWRLALGPGSALYAIDDGLENFEELNAVTLGFNGGFPCLEANGVALPEFANELVCQQGAAFGVFTSPALYYEHDSTHAVFSALSYDAARGRFLIGDEVSMWVFSVPASFKGALATPGSAAATAQGVLVECFPCFPSHLASVPNGIGALSSINILVDVVRGTIKSADLWPGATATATPAPQASGVAGVGTRGLLGGVSAALIAATLATVSLAAAMRA